MPKFQIEFNHGGGSKSFEYINAKTDIEEKAAAKATRCIINRKSGATYWNTARKPPKTLMVRECHGGSAIKRGGYKFKLKLAFFAFSTDSGRKERREWYEYND